MAGRMSFIQGKHTVNARDCPFDGGKEPSDSTYLHAMSFYRKEDGVRQHWTARQRAPPPKRQHVARLEAAVVGSTTVTTPCCHPTNARLTSARQTP